MGRVEELILQRNWRGMDILRRYLPEDFCSEAAEAILSWERGTVILTTGFYVAGHAETDGPPGTLFLAKALEKLGFCPLVITDEICRGYFERTGIPVEYLPVTADDSDCQAVLARHQSVGLIAVERCGKNICGIYENAKGGVFEDHTAPTDRLFELTDRPTIGIGDGGNEVGMGKLADVIAERLPLTPCRVSADYLIVATVSNWGAVALAACVGGAPTEQEYLDAYELAYEMGFVDGFTEENVRTEDRFPLEVGLQLLRDLKSL